MSMQTNVADTEKKQQGFSHVVVIVAFIVVTAVGVIGWRVWHSSKSQSSKADAGVVATATPPSKSTEEAGATAKPAIEGERLILTQGFSLGKPSRLKALPTRKTTTYAPTATTSVLCHEITTLVPNDEEYVTADQFNITIEVCERDPSKGARDWYIHDVQDAHDLLGEKADVTINGNDGLKYSSPDGVQQHYVIVSGEYGVIIGGEFFKGNHYSFKGDKDYSPYKADLDVLANSLIN